MYQPHDQRKDLFSIENIKTFLYFPQQIISNIEISISSGYPLKIAFLFPLN